MKILGTGSALPELTVTNDDLSRIMDTSDAWISSRTGIRERHVLSGENLFDLACLASERALENAGRKRGRAGSYNMLDRAGRMDNARHGLRGAGAPEGHMPLRGHKRGVRRICVRAGHGRLLYDRGARKEDTNTVRRGDKPPCGLERPFQLHTLRRRRGRGRGGRRRRAYKDAPYHARQCGRVVRARQPRQLPVRRGRSHDDKNARAGRLQVRRVVFLRGS